MRYETGIQATVFDIIKKSHNNKQEYITKRQIVQKVKEIRGEHPKIDMKVGQALNVLQKRMAFKRPRIKKVYDEEKKRNIGWTLAEEEIKQTNNLWEFMK